MYSVLMQMLYLTVELTSCPRAKTTCVCLELMDEKSSLKVVHLCYDPCDCKLVSAPTLLPEHGACTLS